MSLSLLWWTNEYLQIPMTLQCRYVVCHGVPKFKTIPIPMVPILETPQVTHTTSGYPWSILIRLNIFSYELSLIGTFLRWAPRDNCIGSRIICICPRIAYGMVHLGGSWHGLTAQYMWEIQLVLGHVFWPGLFQGDISHNKWQYITWFLGDHNMTYCMSPRPAFYVDSGSEVRIPIWYSPHCVNLHCRWLIQPQQMSQLL